MRGWTWVGLSAVVFGIAAGACAGGGEADSAPSGGKGGADAAAGTGGSGATGGSAGSAGAGGVAGSGGSGGSGGSAGAGGSAGSGGSGGGVVDAGSDAAGWPTCDAQPSGVAAKTIQQIWADDPASPTEVWVAGVYVTAISGGACSAGSACQIYLQQDETYGSLALGAKRAIKLRISNNASQYFTGLAVGDRVDVLGHAWRFNLGGANELVLQVNALLQGCAKKIGSGNPTPITGVQLSDLTVTAYELTHGPLLVQVANVSGKPAAPGEIFGLWPTGVGIGDAAPTDLVSVSPFFLPGFSFSGLTAGQTVDFASVTGVFGQYIPFTDAAAPDKYQVLYPRSMSELVQ